MPFLAPDVRHPNARSRLDGLSLFLHFSRRSDPFHIRMPREHAASESQVLRAIHGRPSVPHARLDARPAKTESAESTVDPIKVRPMTRPKP